MPYFEVYGDQDSGNSRQERMGTRSGLVSGEVRAPKPHRVRGSYWMEHSSSLCKWLSSSGGEGRKREVLALCFGHSDHQEKSGSVDGKQESQKPPHLARSLGALSQDTTQRV